MKRQGERRVWCCQKTKNRRPVREQVSVASLVAYIRTRTLRGPRRNVEGSTPRRKTINPFFAVLPPFFRVLRPCLDRDYAARARGARAASAFWETGSSFTSSRISIQYDSIKSLSLSLFLKQMFTHSVTHSLSKQEELIDWYIRIAKGSSGASIGFRSFDLYCAEFSRFVVPGRWPGGQSSAF